MALMTSMDSTKTGKRLGLAGFAIFVLAGFCFGQATSPHPPSGGRRSTHVLTDWSQFHRNNMERWNPYEKFLTVNNVGQLGLKWTYNAGSGGVESSPAVVNGVVYLGAGDFNVYAVNARTGASLWSYATGNEVYSSPAVANGVVYAGSYDGNVYALNARTGVKLWSYNTGGDVYSSPAVVNEVVYIGSLDGNVYALSAHTGTLLWSYQTGGWVYSSPAVANGVVYVGSCVRTRPTTNHAYLPWIPGVHSDNVYALDAHTGAKLWSYNTGGCVDSSPSVANGVVYIGAPRRVYAFNASTGAKLWSYATGDLVSSTPAVANGVVYVGSDYNQKMLALKASTGAKLWTYTTDGWMNSSPAVANGVVYFGSGDPGAGNIYALDASTGALLWSYTTGWVDSSPAVVNGVVYVSSWDGSLYAFSLKHGSE